MFDPMFIAVYNLFYTSLPVLAIGVFDQDVSDKNSIMYPQLYTPGHTNLLFNKKEFLRSALYGFYTSCILFFIPYGMHYTKLFFQFNKLSEGWIIIYYWISGTYKDAVTSRGHVLSDHMLVGSVVATILVIVVTAQVNIFGRNKIYIYNFSITSVY